MVRFETGNIVGALAWEFFPNGREIAYNTNFDEMVKQTTKYIDDGILVMVDVLEIHVDGVCIYEVKSSSSVKDI